TGNDGVNGYKTWQSDGSDAGTIIATGIGNPGSGNMQELVETDNNIFASISQTDIGRELWAISYSSVLPLDLLEFKGKLVNNDGILNWETGNEINVADFVVERSINGNSYIAVGNVKPVNAPGTHNYVFTDANITSLGSDIVYYRLKQKDIDSRYTYSKIISLSIKNTTGSSLYPNPASGEINLAVVASRKEKMDYQFFDNAGRIVLQKTTQVLAGTNRFSVDINKLPAGVYYIKLSSNSISEKFQFLKH
ncbi:MAG TPA: T9SS type A sorting domain-containing protein, partial [Chitinophagaceae bacterium]|nr:T9SS type A sorting domain-containing protein [Chitinophagaceae bacterium]